MQNKPSPFYCMAGIQCSSIDMVNYVAVRCYLLHHTFNFVFYKITFDFINPMIYQSITTFITYSTAQLLCSVHHYHRYTNTFCWSNIGILWRNHARFRSIIDTLTKYFTCAISSMLIACCLRIRSSCDYIKCFRKIITSFANWPSISCYMKKHASICIETMLI